MSVNMSGSGTASLGVGVGSYQPGVYVPLKALFLVYNYLTDIKGYKANFFLSSY